MVQARTLQYKNRWFCYLDLLGFKDLVRSVEMRHVIDLYDEVIEMLVEGAGAEVKKSLGISYSWFSDTFILFSRGDSLHEFSLLEQAGRLFFQRLILARIPVRGALSHGLLYSNLEKNIFIGEALIDAYEYGEKQNWLGLLLAPSVYEKLAGTELDVRSRYCYRPVLQAGIITHSNSENVYAFAFNNGTVNGENPLLSAIQHMKRMAPEQYQIKYTNTEQFILEHADS